MAAMLVLSSFALFGCESNNQSSLPRGERGGMAGGNGEFGENPARAGDYNRGNNTATHSDAGTNQAGNSR
jgi:hypothetical protein